MIYYAAPQRVSRIKSRLDRKLRQLEDEAGHWHAVADEAQAEVERLRQQLAEMVEQRNLLAQELAGSQEAYYSRMRDWVLENTSKENERLRSQLARLPKAASVTLPAREISLKKSPLQQEIVRLMGATGLGRAWRITDRVLDTGEASSRNSVSNAIGKLKALGLVDDYRRDGKPVRFAVAAGGERRLVLLPEAGREWYRQAFGADAIESEVAVMARKHKSVEHGVGILEARDMFRAAGYEVNDNPVPLLTDAANRWGARSEPDLVVVIEHRIWPVEVQRVASERFTRKWTKMLEHSDRLLLVLFNQEQLRKQERILQREAHQGKLVGQIVLLSLELMQRGYWSLPSPVKW